MVPDSLPIDYDGASIPVLLEYLSHADGTIRCDAACALGDRLRTREIERFEPPVQARLVALLGDGIWSVRLEAAIALAEAGDHHATLILLDATRVRAFRLDAIRALGTSGDAAAIGPLGDMMRRWVFPWADRLQAAAALCALGDPAGAAYLVSKLTSRRRPERAAAIHFLGESRHPEGCRLLTQILHDAKDPMRDVAVRALGLLRDPQAREPLRAVLADADAELTQDIHDALAKLPAT